MAKTKIDHFKRNITLGNILVVRYKGINIGPVTMISKRGVNVSLQDGTVFVKWCNVISIKEEK